MGATPLLIARTCLEEWGVVQDYREGTILLKDRQDSKWIKVDRDDKGHFIFDLLGGFPSKEDEIMNADVTKSDD